MIFFSLILITVVWRYLSDQWKNMSKALNSAGHSLVAVQDNLIDVVWPDRPERPSTQLHALGLEYTGQCPTVLTIILYYYEIFLGMPKRT